VGFHVHAASSEAHTFSFQAQTLFDGRVPTELDLAARAEHALPGQTDGASQDPRYLP